MTDLAAVQGWIAGYQRAWESERARGHRRALQRDARYWTAPFRDPWQGRDAIVAGWLDRKDEPGSATFTWHPVVITGDVAVVQGTTTYADETFSNLWVLRLDADGRCREFTEWWMQHPG